MRRIRLGTLGILVVIALAFAAGVITELSGQREAPASADTAEKVKDKEKDKQESQELQDGKAKARGIRGELGAAAVRLPIAALLGTVLALRPRRMAAVRSSVVVQTQIVLACVGALIMLVVGASLARAFGIVGVASLVRYRSRIDDPKDAVVMLSALAVGLACGVGLFFLALFSTLFLIATLWVIESFEPEVRTFELKIKLGEDTAEQRSRIDRVLRRYVSDFELRGSSPDGATYLVRAPAGFSTEEATESLSALMKDKTGAVEWVEKPKVK